MDEKELLSGVRWRIIEVLANEGELGAADIAKGAQTSLPAVSQATKLLEAYGYLRARPLPRDNPGKPKLLYDLNKESAHVALCTRGVAKQFSFTPSSLHTATLRAFQLPAQDQDWIIQLLWNYRNLLRTIDAVAYVRSEEAETHIIVLTSDVDSYRRKYSRIELEADGKTRKIISWSHTIKEAREGLENGEDYYVNLFKNPVVLYDPENVMPHG